MVIAAIAGASGYAGGELLRLLASHPQISVGPLAAGGRAGESVGAVHPNLTQYADLPLVETTAQVLADADIVFLALPHGQSAALAEQLPAGTVVIDAVADHRLESPAAGGAFYRPDPAGTGPHGPPELAVGRARGRTPTEPRCYTTLAMPPT